MFGCATVVLPTKNEIYHNITPVKPYIIESFVWPEIKNIFVYNPYEVGISVRIECDNDPIDHFVKINKYDRVVFSVNSELDRTCFIEQWKLLGE